MPRRGERFFAFKGFKALTKAGGAQGKSGRLPTRPSPQCVREESRGGERTRLQQFLLPETAGQLPRSPQAGYPSGKGREQQ